MGLPDALRITNIDKGNHTFVIAGDLPEPQNENPANCPIDLIALNIHSNEFFSCRQLKEKMKTHFWHALTLSNVQTSYNPNYHCLKTQPFIKDDLNNATLIEAIERLCVIKNLLLKLKYRLHELINNLAKEIHRSLLNQKLEMIDYYENKLNDLISSLPTDYPEALSEIEMEEINNLISYFLHGFYRITMPPLSHQYPRNWLSNTKWNPELQPAIYALKEIRKELESELLTWGDTWLQLAQTHQSSDHKPYPVNEPVEPVATSRQHSSSPLQ